MEYAVGIFCGSRIGARPEYMAAARACGQELARRGMGMVYGGGNVGLMGACADAVLEGGGRVIGVIPEFLQVPEIMHEGITETVIVDDLFERKAVMIERADAFIALPGGIGTYDELLEVVAWRQLGQIRQPIGLLDVGGYFAPLRALIEHTVAEGFLSVGEYEHIVFERDIVELLDRMVEGR